MSIGLNGHTRKATREQQGNQGALIGWKQICEYLGLSVSSCIKYRRLEALPVCHLPDGRMFTSKCLIDQWILARLQAEQDNSAQPDIVVPAQHVVIHSPSD